MFCLFYPTALAQIVPDTIPAGTRLRVKLENPLSSRSSRVGDGVEARLIEPVRIHDHLVLPEGTYLSGRVTALHSANRKEQIHAALGLSFENITLPDGRVLKAKSSIQSLGMSLDVDREGAVTQPVPSTADKVGAVAAGAATGAGIGAIAGSGKGAARGAAIGSAVMVLADWAAASAQWDEIELKQGRKMWLRIDQDLVVGTGKAKSPTASITPVESPSEEIPNAQPTPPATPRVRTTDAETQPKSGLRILLTDRKSWEASRKSIRGLSTSANYSSIAPPKPEYLKAFNERCPAVVVTVQQDKADFIVFLDHNAWRSPPYKVAVLTRDGDAIFSGGTQLLGNAVKDVCAALTARR